MSEELPWWQTDTYATDVPLPPVFQEVAGPQGVALVKVYGDGRTQPGWGLLGPKNDSGNGFALRYPRGEFNSRRVLYGYERDKWAFAIVMRSVRVVCVDIDGKNGGLEHAKKLGMLPPTLSETSKSGNGYHLFYAYDETWRETKGFGELADRIGIVEGVDIRATGCVFHHKQQRWNVRDLAPLPDHLADLLKAREQKIHQAHDRIIAVLDEEDEMEILMMQAELEADLRKPIPQGKRNNTLFAIGTKMVTAGIPDWEKKLEARAVEIGLDDDEIQKMLANCARYGGPQ